MKETGSDRIETLARYFVTPFILLLAAVVRFYHLSGQSLWADEGNSAALAQRSFIEIAGRTAFDIHPPLYYWLLKIWVAIFGPSEIGLRSLSVVLGVATVYLIGVLGTRLFSGRVGRLAAFIAALSPLQVYYSQEARMYMLLAFLSTLTVLLAVHLWQNRDRPVARSQWAVWLYVLTATAGLYTHYAYPLMLVVVNLAVMFWFWKVGKKPSKQSSAANLQSPSPNSQFTIYHWFFLQLGPLLLYLPWLPTAWRQITTWPSERAAASWLTIVETISTTLLFGLSWPFNLGLIVPIALAIILLLTLYVEGSTFNVQRSTFNLLLLWFLLPVALTAIIFTPAFLKFLLVAAPALALLLALAIDCVKCQVSRLTDYGLRTTSYCPQTAYHFPVLPNLTAGLILTLISAGSALSLYHYYFNPTFARDNYRAIVSFIKAVGGPDDAVILNAEGQQEVFNYYYTQGAAPPAPVYPLPRRRPLDAAATTAELAQIAGQAHKIYAVYWATQQADPQGLIENWLNTHLYKATDQWYGNVRLVSYAAPQAVETLPLTPADYRLGPQIRLLGYTISAPQIWPGDILQVRLLWQTDSALKENYTVFLQVLDSSGHVVGQRDAPPHPATSQWPVGQPLSDAHGIFIEPGTPPGLHRLIAGLYNSQTGQRLSVSGGSDFIELGPIEVVRSSISLPLEAFKIQVPLNIPMLNVTLLGYDLYKVGHRSDPNTPLHPGDPIQLTVYWQANQPAQSLTDQLVVQIVSSGGGAPPISLMLPPAGVNYPIQQWQPGEIIRAQYSFFLENLAPGSYRVNLTLQGTETSAAALTQPFRIE